MVLPLPPRRRRASAYSTDNTRTWLCTQPSKSHRVYTRSCMSCASSSRASRCDVRAGAAPSSTLSKGGSSSCGSSLRSRVAPRLRRLLSPRALDSPLAVPVCKGGLPPRVLEDVRRQQHQQVKRSRARPLAANARPATRVCWSAPVANAGSAAKLASCHAGVEADESELRWDASVLLR